MKFSGFLILLVVCQSVFSVEYLPGDRFNYQSLADDYYQKQDYRLALVNYLHAFNALDDSAFPDKGRKGLVKKIAKIYRKSGNYYAALNIFQVEVARDPEADWAVQKIGQWMLKYGNSKVGMRWLRRATDMQGSPDKAWRKLGGFIQQQSTYRYIRFLREERDRFPYLASSWDRLVEALLEDERGSEAEYVIAHALSLFQANSLWRTAQTPSGRILIGQYAHKLDGKLFTAMGCGPYTVDDEQALKHYLKIENAVSASEFIIHLGDLGKGMDEVAESRYANMADILSRQNDKPTFVIPGDNDWNDTSDPVRSLGYWKRHLGHFYRLFKPPFKVTVQAKREENFSFELDDVVYIGINLPEGMVHDAAEWQLRIGQNSEWIKHNLTSSHVKAAVIMAHAPADVFDGLLLNSLRPDAIEFGKPLLFLHANGHKWVYRKDQQAANITHVQLNKLHDDKPGYPPVQIRVTGRDDIPFVFDRRIASPEWLVKNENLH